MSETKTENTLTLKWGFLKSWNLESDEASEAINKVFDAGPVSSSAAMNRPNEAQKQALCDLIDLVDEPIYSDWDGKKMTRQEAKDYVNNYGNNTNE